MKILELPFDVRWADIDANKHMRHSAYYDYATHLRVQLLRNIGMDIATLSKLEIGPVLFREEAVFIREDGSRWTFYHEFHKDEEKVAATVTVDSAWIDLKKRKLTALPDHFLQLMLEIPRAEDFEFDIKSHVKKPENRHIQSKPDCFTQLLLTKIH